MAEAEILDLRSLKCPLPALMAKKALARAAPGAVLAVLADDPLAAVDVPHMCHHEGHAVQSVTEKDGYRVFLLRRGPAA
jgi:tRNA 2-thiouridine synthesizing protein A